MPKLSELMPLPDRQLISPGKTLAIDLYIMLPLNQSLIQFRQKGDVLSPADCERLAKVAQEHLFFPRAQLAAMAIDSTLESGEIDSPVIRSVAKAVLKPPVVAGQSNAQSVHALLSEAPQLVEDMVASFSQHKKYAFTSGSYGQILKTMKFKDDPITSHHRQVSAIAVLILLAVGNNTFDEVAAAGSAGLLHDLGLQNVSQDIMRRHLSGNGFFTPAERIPYMKHVDHTLDIIKQANTPVSPLVLKTIEQHHENWDGSGFPRGLVSIGIFRPARGLRIADDLICILNQPGTPLNFREAVEMIADQKSKTGVPLYDPEMTMTLLS